MKKKKKKGLVKIEDLKVHHSTNFIRDKDIRSICEIQDVTRWVKIRKRAWRDHENRMDDNKFAKIAKNGKGNSPKPPGLIRGARR